MLNFQLFVVSVLLTAVAGKRFSHLALSLTPEGYPGADTWLMVQFRLPPGHFSDQYYHNLTVSVPSGYVLAPRCRMATLTDCGRLVREDCVYDSGSSVAVGVLGGFLDPAQTCSVIFGVRVPLYVDPADATQSEWSVSLDGHSTERPIRVVTFGLIPGVTGWVMNPGTSVLTEVHLSFLLTTPVEQNAELTILVPSGFEVVCDLGFRSTTLTCLREPILGFLDAYSPGSRHEAVVTARNPTAETTYAFDWGLELGDSPTYRGYFQTQMVVGHFTTSFSGSCVFTSPTLPGSCTVHVQLQDAVETDDELYLLLPFGYSAVDPTTDLRLALTGKSSGDVVQHTFPNVRRSSFQPPAVADFAVLHRKPLVASQPASAGEYLVKRSGEFGVSQVVGATAVTLTEEAGVQSAGVRGSLKLVLGSVSYGVKSGVVSSSLLDLSDVISVFPVWMRSYVIFRNGNIELTWPESAVAAAATAGTGGSGEVTLTLEGMMFPEETGGGSVTVEVELSDETGVLLERGESAALPISRRMEIGLGVDCSPDELPSSPESAGGSTGGLECNAEKVYYGDEGNVVRATATLTGGDGVVAVGDVLEVITGAGFKLLNVQVKESGTSRSGVFSSTSLTTGDFAFTQAVSSGIFVIEMSVDNPTSLPEPGASEDAMKWYFRVRSSSSGFTYLWRFDVGWIPFTLIRGVAGVSLTSVLTNDPLQVNVVRLVLELGLIGLPAADFLILQAPSGFIFPTDCFAVSPTASRRPGVGPTGLTELFLGTLTSTGLSTAGSTGDPSGEVAAPRSFVGSCVGEGGSNKARLRVSVDELEGGGVVYEAFVKVRNSDSERLNGYWRLLTFDRDDAVLYRHFGWIQKPYIMNILKTQLLAETGRVGDWMWLWFWVQMTIDTPAESLVFLQTPEGAKVKVKCGGSTNFRVAGDAEEASCAGSDTLAVVTVRRAKFKGEVLLVAMRVLVEAAASGSGAGGWWKARVLAPGGVYLTSSSDVAGWITSADTKTVRRGMDKMRGVFVLASGNGANLVKVVLTFQASVAIAEAELAEVRLKSPPGWRFQCSATNPRWGLSAGGVGGFFELLTDLSTTRTGRCSNGEVYNELWIPVRRLAVADEYQGKRTVSVEVEKPVVESREVATLWEVATVRKFPGGEKEVVEYGRMELMLMLSVLGEMRSEKEEFEEEWRLRLGEVYKRVMRELLEREGDMGGRELKLEMHMEKMRKTLEGGAFREMARRVSERVLETALVVETPMDLPELEGEEVTLGGVEELMGKIEAEVKKIATWKKVLGEFEEMKAEYVGKELTVVDKEESV